MNILFLVLAFIFSQVLWAPEICAFKQIQIFRANSCHIRQPPLKNHLDSSPSFSKSSRIHVKRLRMDLNLVETASIAVFDAQNWASQVVTKELTHITPLSLGILYLGGLLTSFSPCAISMLPLTVSYLGGMEAMEQQDEESNKQLLVSSALFALGLATALSSLGLGATLLGKVYGQVSGPSDLILPAVASTVAIFGGLTVLELVNFNLPSLDTGDFKNLPKPLRAFTLGASSALISSPCSTPVLGSLLGFLAVSQNPALGMALLFAYTMGYTTPIVMVGAASGVVTRRVSPSSVAWVTPLTGSVLIFYGVYNLLSILFPEAY